MWNASSVKIHLSQIVAAAIAGTPQFVGRQNGKQVVVVVSRDYFERTRPNLNTFVLSHGYCGDGEAVFDAILRDLRLHGSDPLSRSTG